MLLCLGRQQRIVFILGAIFNIKSNIAAQNCLTLLPKISGNNCQERKPIYFSSWRINAVS